MSRTMYNCPNCAAPIGYHEVCPYCGTALYWMPTVSMMFKTERRGIKKCVAAVVEPIEDWLPERYVDGPLKEQLAQACSKVWERETKWNRSDLTIEGVPPHTARHTATVYFAVKEEQV